MIREDGNIAGFEQVFVGGDEGQLRNLGGGEQETIGGVAMRKSQPPGFPRNLISDWSFL